MCFVFILQAARHIFIIYSYLTIPAVNLASMFTALLVLDTLSLFINVNPGEVVYSGKWCIPRVLLITICV
jgi:hypothetical protein